MEIQDGDGRAELWSIGRLASASGLSVKTIRFYSDADLLPPRRTSAGHRRYTSADLARLQLIGGLRSLDVDLPTIAALLAGSASMQQVLSDHAEILQVRLAALERQLAVARAVVDAPPEHTVARLQLLSRLEAANRDRLLERFWSRALHRAPEDDTAWFASAGIPKLPIAPTGEQIDAWLELAELAADADFQRVVRAQATWFADHTAPDLDAATWRIQMDLAFELAHQARGAGVAAEDPRAHRAVNEYVAAHAAAFGEQPTSSFRRWLDQELSKLTDPRTERWWKLVGMIEPPMNPPPRRHADVAWLHQALSISGPKRGVIGEVPDTPVTPGLMKGAESPGSPNVPTPFTRGGWGQVESEYWPSQCDGW
ncbi:MerR family transcriptional regulator [Paenarthrobacter sp. PH39-S1]|uniref:MerR family transcriptional regulator n=1 Tax=Paenarthrobacter sp. PH39-S1 TaxID=3046204 RepID=UPI0024B9D630|nr:MerR family transcriptional regulator [Paenarthrobacter sp. PH39-S1]MDJ0356616.1 MerR family transcriptional regulator [Paenarthrobacter sp. PH39-S1]